MIKRLKDLLHPIYRRWVLYPRIRRIYQERIRLIRERGTAKVVFLVSNLAMWRLQSLYDILVMDKRFSSHILLLPFAQFSEDERIACMKELRNYFTEKGIPFTDSTTLQHPEQYYEELDPDIVFYPQPYEHLYDNYAEFSKNTHRLSVYVPYAALTVEQPWVFNTPQGRVGWRNYFESRDIVRVARHYSWSGGRNLRACGYILGDLFSSSTVKDVWKPQAHKKKRIIWAPHFSGVNPNGLLKRGSFLWMSDLMQEIAVQYKDVLQIAFKPHPRLQTELENAPGWGLERTEAYYHWWENQDNTQLERGQYIDLFKSSDAMIHDCGSFTIDYLYTGKPVLFASSNLGETVSTMNPFGKEALAVHELGENADDILDFISRILQDSTDPKSADKAEFLSSWLGVKKGEMVAERIQQDILKAIRFKK